MISYTPEVVRKAFENTIGTRVSDDVLTECVDEFLATYWDEGAEDAFKGALSKFAPKVTFSDKLFSRFENALKAASEAAERKAAEEAAERKAEAERKAAEKKKEDERKAAERLKKDINDAVSLFESHRQQCRDVRRDILNVDIDAKKLVWRSDDQAVITIAQEVSALAESANSLFDELRDPAAASLEAVRSENLIAAESAARTAHDTLEKLKDLLVLAKGALTRAEQAANDAATRKTEAERDAAIKKAVDDSGKDLRATEQVVRDLQKGVEEYKLAYYDLHGKELEIDDTDLDNVEKLVKRANQALEDARTAQGKVASAATAKDRGAAEAAAQNVNTELVKAQKELNKLNLKIDDVNQALAARERRKVITVRKKEEKKEAEEEKVSKLDQLFSSWQGHAALFAGFLLAAITAWLLFPWWLQAIFLVAAIVAAAGYAFSWLKKQPEKGVVTVGGYIIIVVLVAAWIAIVPAIGKGPGSDRDLIPNQATEEPTSRAEIIPTIPSEEQLATEAAKEENNP